MPDERTVVVKRDDLKMLLTVFGYAQSTMNWLRTSFKTPEEYAAALDRLREAVGKE